MTVRAGPPCDAARSRGAALRPTTLSAPPMSRGYGRVMARTPATPTSGHDGKTRLRWPRSRTAAELAQRLNEGEGIRAALSAPDALHRYEEVARHSQRWHERSRTILDQAFVPSLIHEYDPPRGSRISSIHDSPDRSVRRM